MAHWISQQMLCCQTFGHPSIRPVDIPVDIHDGIPLVAKHTQHKALPAQKLCCTSSLGEKKS
eukprot:558466-Pelagomonas_calceolata.AAC.2